MVSSMDTAVACEPDLNRVHTGTRVLLINQEHVPHYRVLLYGYMAKYLSREGFALTVASEGVQPGSTDSVEFQHQVMPLTFRSLSRFIEREKFDTVIFWVRLRYPYLFPLMFLLRIRNRKVIYWGHGIDLLDKSWSVRVKRFLNNIEYRICDALIIYAEHLRRNVNPAFHTKLFVANNTLLLNGVPGPTFDRRRCLAKYGITTPKNVICCGRLQRRKRLEDLFSAFQALDRKDVGLILVGPDDEGVLRGVKGDNIHILGPIYGADRLELLAASDVFCLPGAVGLSIVDAFQCGLPLVSEEGDESPEIMYLKDGVNGFAVKRGDVKALASKLRLLLDDDSVRQLFGNAARQEIRTAGHIDRMCEGFAAALRFVHRQVRV